MRSPTCIGSNVSGYLDLEAKLDKLTLGAAGRLEHYSDFGTTVNGKLSARFEATPWPAVRGTVSTGFRAPSPQQQYYTSTSSVLTSGNIVETGLFPSTGPIGVALGGKPLRPEKATCRLTATASASATRSLSENLSGAVVIQRLRDGGVTSVTAARYFLNGIRSTTKGVDIVAHYRTSTTTCSIPIRTM